MPPWHLDKTVGIRHYKNDRSLSDDEIATVAAMGGRRRAAGQPRGHADAAHLPADADWFIGEPDLKVTTPNDFTMYANGPDWWIDQFADVTHRRGSLDQGDGDQAEQSRRSSITS